MSLTLAQQLEEKRRSRTPQEPFEIDGKTFDFVTFSPLVLNFAAMIGTESEGAARRFASTIGTMISGWSGVTGNDILQNDSQEEVPFSQDNLVLYMEESPGICYALVEEFHKRVEAYNKQMDEDKKKLQNSPSSG